jgi:type II secretory pathway pseudopilin PulG
MEQFFPKMISLQKIGQVWIETVLYTLIALALIGMVLGFVMPKINQSKDKLAIEQTVDLLTLLDDKINHASETTGNVRLIDFTIKRGTLDFLSSDNSILFTVSALGQPYSEPGITIKRGPVSILTEKRQKDSAVYLTLNYSSKNYNLLYNGAETNKRFTAASTPYKITVANNGTSNGMIVLNVQDTS